MTGRVVRGQASFPRVRLAAVASLAAILLAVSAGPINAYHLPHKYAGWIANGSWNGVDGYIRQSTTVPLSNDQAHVNFINICGSFCNSWAQTGTIQGMNPDGFAYYSTVRTFWENMNGCFDYYFGDAGAPPTPNYPYYVSWNGGASFDKTCNNGSQVTSYTWEWRKGSFTNNPFHYGSLANTFGQASAATEVIDLATIGTDRFGCDHSLGCSNQSYGLHLYNGSTWSLMTNAVVLGPDNPPYLHTYGIFWSFVTCPVSC